MNGGGTPRVERRRGLRAAIRLPVQIRDVRAIDHVEVGTTLDLSPTGLLAEFPKCAYLDFPELVQVHVGLAPELWRDTNGRFAGRVTRLVQGSPTRCAVEAAGPPPPFLAAPELVGKHPSILEVKRQLAEIAACSANVLIRGESGTGKSFVARLIHRYSSRAKHPFLRQNCPAIPETLLESQLFGHVKGAFTDAKTARPGMFRLAHQGSIVLDEISSLPCSVQGKLLQAIDEKRFYPVGGAREAEVDVRVIATTNDDLDRMMGEGAFRPDLFYRLNELSLSIPPLRERRSDVPLLADYFLRKNAEEFGKPYQPLLSAQIERLVNYSWPGNVRELDNAVKRFLLMGRLELGGQDAASVRSPRKAPERFSMPAVPRGELRSQLAATEAQAILEALQAAGHNRTRAAAVLGVSYRTLLRKIKKYRVEA
ncbi:sigma-54 interaction domain-containing protein [Planctomycetota bacterium]